MQFHKVRWGDDLAIAILDEQLKIGQVKTITSDFGKYIDYVELLFSPTTKAQFQPSDDKTGIVFSVSDNNLDLPEMVCELSRDTIRNLIVSLKNMYNELELENDNKPLTENKGDNDKKPCGICPQKR